MVLSALKNLFTKPHYSDYSYTDYRRYFSMIKSGGEYSYSKLEEISTLARNNIPQILNGLGNLLWTNKYWVIGASTLSLVAFIARKHFRNRPQYPIVKMQSSLNYAKFSIGMLKKKELPPNVTLTFCVDTSSSMIGDRENEVKTAVKNILESALKVVNTIKGAKIGIAIIGFNSEPRIICKPTWVTSKNIATIKANLEKYSSSGTTTIIKGLDAATNKLEEMAKNNKAASHSLILLTDGEDDIQSSVVKPIHERLAKLGARLFAVGIGEEHTKETLRKIAPKKGKFKGTYIDTTDRKVTISSAISRIYNQSIASFSDFVLCCPQLRARTWSVNGTSSKKIDGKSTVKLGSLSKGKTMKLTIMIDPKKLQKSLDLSKVSFQLTFRDPRGRRGRLSLPWKPNSIIDPTIVV